MTSPLDRTHHPGLRSFVASANGHGDFPIQNLPIGIFAPRDGKLRPGIAIGDSILDLSAALRGGLLTGDAAAAAEAASGETLNAFVALGAAPRQALRASLSSMLTDGSAAAPRLAAWLHDSSTCRMALPMAIGDYTDFYVGIHHATNIGKQFRPDNPLLPNYKHLPIGYHGRASSVRPSGVGIARPNGQTKGPDEAAPSFRPCRRLDYELELGIWVGRGNAPGAPIPIAQSSSHVGGFCLLNDWSARDIQAWEYQPLGPFLAKNFGSTISCWVVSPEALAPFRIAQPERPAGDPRPLPYLMDATDQAEGAFAIGLDVYLISAAMRAQGLAPYHVSSSDTRHMYWTVAQMIAHHTSGGCDLRPGDLLGSGTISGPDRENCGSLMETTLGGREPLQLPSGEQRRFLEDGDQVVFAARARRDGFAAVGFGTCQAMIAPAPAIA